MLSIQDELLMKKRMLRVRSERLRQTLGYQLESGLGPSLGNFDRVISAAQWMRRHPAWVAVPLVTAAVFVLRRKAVARGLVPTLSRWAVRGMWAWHTWLRIQPFVGAVRMMQAVRQ
jgi:hypothetical protein